MQITVSFMSVALFAVIAQALFAAGLLANKAYLNIHTTTFPGGEISLV